MRRYTRLFVCTICIFLLFFIGKCPPGAEARKKRKKKSTSDDVREETEISVDAAEAVAEAERRQAWREMEILTDIGVHLLKSKSMEEKYEGAMSLLHVRIVTFSILFIYFGIPRGRLLSLFLSRAGKGESAPLLPPIPSLDGIVAFHEFHAISLYC